MISHIFRSFDTTIFFFPSRILLCIFSLFELSLYSPTIHTSYFSNQAKFIADPHNFHTQSCTSAMSSYNINNHLINSNFCLCDQIALHLLIISIKNLICHFLLLHFMYIFKCNIQKAFSGYNVCKKNSIVVQYVK